MTDTVSCLFLVNPILCSGRGIHRVGVVCVVRGACPRGGASHPQCLAVLLLILPVISRVPHHSRSYTVSLLPVLPVISRVPHPSRSYQLVPLLLVLPVISRGPHPGRSYAVVAGGCLSGYDPPGTATVSAGPGINKSAYQRRGCWNVVVPPKYRHMPHPHWMPREKRRE